MYVAPTPFGLVSGVAHTQTLILPDGFPITKSFRQVGVLVRREADKLIVGYTFSLKTNTLTPKTIHNPSAGHEHVFQAWRLAGSSREPVFMRKSDIGVGKEEYDDTDE
jgi:hypothetical protein